MVTTTNRGNCDKSIIHQLQYLIIWNLQYVLHVHIAIVLDVFLLHERLGGNTIVVFM